MVALFNRDLVINAGGLQIATRDPDTALARPTLRVVFKIIRALAKDPNSAEISIYNLSAESRAKLQEKDIPTTVEAGYVGNISRIFGGTLDFGGSFKEGDDWITRVQSGDGSKAFRTARVNRSLKGPISPGQVLKIAGEALGLPLGNLTDAVSKGSQRASLKEFANGVMLSGKSEQVFDKIVKAMGFDWSIQDGQIQVLAPKDTVGDVIVLERSSGLIGTPSPGDKGVVKARSLLQAELAPGRKVEYRSREVNGFFKVQKVTFTGDTWAPGWFADLETSPL